MSNTISIYQSIDQKEKLTNHSSSPELVYSKLTTLSLVLRQLEKEGTGLIFCPNASIPKLKNRFLPEEKIALVDAAQLSSGVMPGKKLVVIRTNERQPVRISELHTIVKNLRQTGTELKWIAILTQTSFNQLFKWELKYN